MTFRGVSISTQTKHRGCCHQSRDAKPETSQMDFADCWYHPLRGADGYPRCVSVYLDSSVGCRLRIRNSRCDCGPSRISPNSSDIMSALRPFDSRLKLFTH